MQQAKTVIGFDSGDKYSYLHTLEPKNGDTVSEKRLLTTQAVFRNGPLFRPVTKNSKRSLNKAMTARGILALIKKYADEVGISASVDSFCVHALRATAITNALEHEADIAKVQEWVGHSRLIPPGVMTAGPCDQSTVRPLELGISSRRRRIP